MGAGLRLLSLDGGGIKGLSELLILKHLMQKIQLAEGLVDEPLPCQYFDMIGGTSAGGLIALMLGRLCMSATDAEKKYRSLSRRIFSRGKKYFGDGKFKTSVFESEVKEIVKGVSTHDDLRLIDPRWTRNDCKTFVCTRIADNNREIRQALFRTYHTDVGASPNCTIWEAARATSSNTTYFKNITIEGVSYCEGDYYNPTTQLIEQAQHEFPGRPIACIISIGTGEQNLTDSPRVSLWERVIPPETTRSIIRIDGNCKTVDAQMAVQYRRNPRVAYLRFNVPRGLKGIGLDDLNQMEKVSSHTANYLNSLEVDEKIPIAVHVLRSQPLICHTCARRL